MLFVFYRKLVKLVIIYCVENNNFCIKVLLHMLFYELEFYSRGCYKLFQRI